MPRNTIDLEFGDGSYTFALPLPQLRELQRKTDTGIGTLYARLMKGSTIIDGSAYMVPGQAEFYALDLIETIRHGLIGGEKGVVNGEEIKVTPIIANRLVDTYVLGAPLVDAWRIATSVVAACMLGFDPPKKDEPAEERAPASTRGRKKASSTTT